MKDYGKATKAGMILLAVLLICLAACSKAGVPKQNSEPEKKDEAAAEVALLSDYWTEGSAAESINEYMSAVTDESSADYIPPEDRIAVFDLDGTLMCETDPFCFEYMVFADYALNSGSDCLSRYDDGGARRRSGRV